MTLSASGVLIVTPDRRALLLKRGPDGDAPGTWAPPGGGIEAGETAATAAVREVYEETGYRVDVAALTPWARRIKDGVDFTTFLCRVDAPFEVKLNKESTGHAWATRPSRCIPARLSPWPSSAWTKPSWLRLSATAN